MSACDVYDARPPSLARVESAVRRRNEQVASDQAAAAHVPVAIRHQFEQFAHLAREWCAGQGTEEGMRPSSTSIKYVHGRTCAAD